MVKYIPLSQNQVAIVDDEDFEKLNTMKWCSHKHGNTFYALRRVKRSHEKFTCMHNDLLFAESPLEIDHVNGNGLDNRKCNLRIVTHRQNCQNFHHNKSSIYPGVCWAKNNKKWKSSIGINGKMKHLGYFSLEKEAFDAYCTNLKNINECLLGNDGISPELKLGV